MKRWRLIVAIAGVMLLSGAPVGWSAWAQEEDVTVVDTYGDTYEEEAIGAGEMATEEVPWESVGEEGVLVEEESIAEAEAPVTAEEFVTTEKKPYYRFVKAPNFFGTTGLIMTPTANTIGNLKFHVGVYGNFYLDDNDAIRKNNKIYYMQPVVGIGLTDYIEVSGSFPYVWYEEKYQLRPGYGYMAERSKDDQGDYRLTVKFKLLDPREAPIGVAVVGFSQFGEGSEDIPGFTGEDTYGVRGVFTYEKEKWILTASLGANFNQAPNNSAYANDWNNTTFAYEIGAGYAPMEDLQLMAEYRGMESRIRGDRDVTIPTGVVYHFSDDRPQAMLVGARYHLGRGFMLNAGIDFGLSHNTDDYRGILGFTWSGPTPSRIKERIVEVSKVVIQEVPKIVRVERMVFSDINFEFDKYSLTTLGKGNVYLIAQKLKEDKNVKVVISGHADYIGSEAYNLNLAKNRAGSIKKELIRLGVDAAQIGDIVSYGETKPLIDVKRPWARAVNRRVEFEVMGADEAQMEEVIDYEEEPGM